MADPVKAAIAILGLALAALFGAWLVVGRTGPPSGSTRETASQGASTPTFESRLAIPGMDAAVPVQTETATFALG